MVLQLREVIEADGRSLNRLAKDTGIDPSRLSRFLRGERDITFEAAARLCDALGVKFVLPRREPPPGESARKPPRPKKK
jgi:transcriptional regulator with XRE-family HTH domain